MKNKIFIIYTILNCAALAAVGAFSFSNHKVNISSSADPTVPHEIKFTYENIINVLDDGYLFIVELSKKTDVGNDFIIDTCEIYNTYESSPSQGDADHNYIFKINQPNWKYESLYSDKVFYFYFEMNLDAANPITAQINWTTHYDDGENTSDSTNTEDFDILTEDDKSYLIDYTFKFSNKYHEYVTINYIQINYSCSY